MRPSAEQSLSTNCWERYCTRGESKISPNSTCLRSFEVGSPSSQVSCATLSPR